MLQICVRGAQQQQRLTEHKLPLESSALKTTHLRASLTFNVMSSEQEASSMPDGSHLMALTSFCEAQKSLAGLSLSRGGGGSAARGQRSDAERAAHRVALEGLEGPVAAKATHVDAHVRAAGGEGGVVLPVDIQCRGCGIRGEVYEPITRLGGKTFTSGLSSATTHFYGYG